MAKRSDGYPCSVYPNFCHAVLSTPEKAAVCLSRGEPRPPGPHHRRQSAAQAARAEEKRLVRAEANRAAREAKRRVLEG